MPMTIEIPEMELYDSSKDLFFTVNKQTLVLEHSLYSISKWESKWKKSFLSSDDKTNEETLDYIRCMTINKNVDPLVYRFIPTSHITEIQNYISDPMTATTFSDDKKDSKKTTDSPKKKITKRKIVTSEEIYYQMTALNIPFECDKWHLNRLLTLIRICSIKNTPPKKISKREVMSRNRVLNEARKMSMHTTG